MSGPLIIDASVFISAFNPAEPQHGESSRLMARIRDEGIPLVAPTLVLPEVAGAISRTTGDSESARSFTERLGTLPGLILVGLDEVLAAQAAEIASAHRLRGSDAVYGAVSLRFGGPLITLDREQHDRLRPAARTRFPEDARRELDGQSPRTK